MTNVAIHVDDSVESLCREIASRMKLMIDESVQCNGSCSLALAGGETPRELYRLLASEPFRSGIPWSHVHIFFGDERMVPPDDLRSNYFMASSVMLSQIPVPAENVHRIQGEDDPHHAATSYERELISFFGSPSIKFDLVLLGVGEDGHTASIFPDTIAVRESERLAVPLLVPSLGIWRVTLTLPVLSKAHNIWFLAAGTRKARIVSSILHSSSPVPEIPATYIRNVDGSIVWFLDADAASLLNAARI